MASDYEPDVMGLEALSGTQVVVTPPGHAYSLSRAGELRLDKNPDGSLRAVTVLQRGGRAVSIGWGAGVLIEPAP